MQLKATSRLYLKDDHCFETEAMVIAIQENKIVCDKTCFYPGGGGQPPDHGLVQFQNGETVEIESVLADDDGVIWHICKSLPALDPVNQSVKLIINRERRIALTRYHTVLHVLNTIALRDYGGWISGVQIGEDYSRIDFKLDSFSPALVPELEEKVNAVLRGNHSLKAYYIPEEEFRRREDLLRALDVKPPVIDGRVRVVEIADFDAQACGGTHVDTTSEVGRFTIFRTDNKGKNNKRFYVKLD
jgi:misacylated tRNA(Ala) deacylase